MNGENSIELSLENLDISLNEHYLWHGTTAAAAESIVQNDFRINRNGVSHGTRFGLGAYFAENLAKSVTYAKSDTGSPTVKTVLLCRVTCGEVYYTEENWKTDSMDVALSLSKNAVLANPNGGGSARE